MSAYITRKEIAAANNLSSETIRRKEKEIGLSGCRDKTCEKPIRFYAAAAKLALRSKGYRIPAT